jgi:hypothetical protein
MAAQPNFFIIGAARSGTSALAEMVRQHPDAFVTRPKEPHFLAFAGTTPHFTGPGDEAHINRIVVTRYEDYMRLYEDTRAAARGDASVSTLYYADESVPNLARFFPDARLIVILRNPVDAAYSNYQYMRVRGFEPLDFEQALDDEERRIDAGWHHQWHYQRLGMYSVQLRPFLEEAGPERVLVLFYDDLQDQPEVTLMRAFRFLRIDPEANVNMRLRVNVSGQPRSRLLQRGIQFATAHPRIKRATKWTVPFRVREWFRSANLRHEPMVNSLRDRLSNHFEKELSETRRLLESYYSPGELQLPEWLRVA